MLTKRKIKIPIFNYIMRVNIYDDKKDIPQELLEDVRVSFKGFTLEYSGCCDVVIKANDYFTLSHEAFHIVNCIWRYIRYSPQRDNDEVSAYLFEYIYGMINKVMNIHNSNKL